MKCKSCGCILSPGEKDDILESLAEGIKPTVICNVCLNEDENEDGQYSEEDIKELRKKKELEMAESCVCGAWQVSKYDTVIHVADCICGNGL